MPSINALTVPSATAVSQVPRKLIYLGEAAQGVSLDQMHRLGWEVHTATSLDEVRALTGAGGFLVGMMHVDPSRPDGQEELARILRADPDMEWIALVPDEAKRSGEVMRLVHDTFYDYHTLPADTDRLLFSLGHAYGMAKLRLQAQQDLDSEYPELIGRSPAARRLFAEMRRVAAADAAVLVTGEIGSGKELVARGIHGASGRSGGPFVALDCSGQTPGALRDALLGTPESPGAIRSADRGVLYVDQISEMPRELQGPLLAFIEHGAIELEGGGTVRADVRVICSSTPDLVHAVSTGRFRKDLYYRINILSLRVPPLRERQGDAELLAQFFFRRFALERAVDVRGFTRESLYVINQYEWPGNVRELMNRVHRAVVMCDRRLIAPSDLGLERRGPPREWVTLEQARTAAERQAIASALKRARNNVSRAAQELGVSRVTLYRLMEKCGIAP